MIKALVKGYIYIYIYIRGRFEDTGSQKDQKQSRFVMCLKASVTPIFYLVP